MIQAGITTKKFNEILQGLEQKGGGLMAGEA